MKEIYDFMQKWKRIDLGQVFTPLHMARFAAKLIDINEEDVVLDSSAGTGALLFSAIERGCKNVYGIEYDPVVYEKLKNNLAQTQIKFEVICEDTSSTKWIKSKPITKALLNPPYEKKYNSAGIVLNTLNSLSSGCLVAMFHQSNFFDKLSKAQKKEMSQHRIEKIIQMPINLFQPFVSVQTSLFIIRTHIPQDNYKFYGYKIEDDGLKRKKGKYREDTNEIWKNELEPKYYNIISNELKDENSTRQNPAAGFMYRQSIDLRPTEEDFKKVVSDYYDWKINNILKDYLQWNEVDQRMAALAFLVGSQNIMDCIDKPDKYFK